MAVIAEEYVTVFSADTSKFDQGIAASNNALKTLSAQIGDSNNALRGFDSEILNARGTLAELAGRMNDLKQAGKGDSDQFRELQSQYQQTAVAMRGLSAAKAQEAADNKNLKASYDQTSQGIKQMETALKQQQAAVEASRFSFSRLHDALGSVSSGMMSGGALLVGVFGGLSAGIGKLLVDASHLQEVFVHVAANTAMSSEQFETMRQVVLNLGATSSKSFEDIAQGYMHIVNFGFQGADATNILTAALHAAVATGADVEKTANTLAGVMHEFGISTADAAQTLDILKIAAAKGNLTLEDMVSVSGKLFSTAANLGLPLRDTAAAFSALTAAGFPAATAATNLMNTFTHIVNPSKEVRGELEKLTKTTGIDLVHDFTQAGLQAKGLTGVLDDLKKATGDNSSEILKLTGGLRGGLAAMALTGNAAADFKQRLQDVDDVISGKLTPTQDAYSRATQTMAFQIGEFQNRMQLLGVTLQTAIGGQFVDMAEKANKALLLLIGFLQQLPAAAIAAGVAFTGAATAVGAAAIVFGGMVALIGGPMTLAIIGLGVDIGILAAAFATDFGQINEAFAAFFGTGTASLKGVAYGVGVFMDGILIAARITVGAVDFMLTALRALATAFIGVKEAALGFGTMIVGVVTGNIGLVVGGMAQMKSSATDAGKALKESFGALAGRELSRLTDNMADFHGKWANTLSSAVDKAGAFASSVQTFASQVSGQLKKMGEPPKPPNDNPLGPTAKNTAKAVKDEILPAINDWLKATSGVEISATVWKKLSDATKLSLASQAADFHKSIDEMQTYRANLMAIMLNLGYEVIKANSEIGISFKKTADTIVVETAKLDSSIRGLAEGVGPAFDAMQDESARLTAGMVADAQKRAESYNAEQAALAKTHDALMLQFDELSHSIPSAWNSIINGILQGSGRLGDELVKLGVSIKGWAGSIFGVLDTIPGAFGKAVKGVLTTVDQWAKFFDNILGFLSKLNSAIPSSIGGALEKVIGLLKGAQSTIASIPVITNKPGYLDPIGLIPNLSGPTADVTKSVGGMSSGVKTAFGAASAAAAGFATSMAVASSASSKAMGFLEATITSTIAGITAAMAFSGPVGAIVGGLSLLGGIIGLFKGKSAAQKQKEDLQLQQLKDQVAMDAQNIVSAAMDSFNKALDFLDRLDDFTPARRKSFTRFFAQLTLLMDYFVELAKVWGKDSLDKAKALADTIGPVANAVGSALTAFEQMNSFVPPAKKIIESFFANLQTLVDLFGQLAEDVPKSLQKQARRFAERLQPVADVIKSALEGFAAMVDFKPITADMMDAFGASLDLAVRKISEIADAIDNKAVKVAARFAERAGAVSALLKSGADGLAAVAALVPIPAGAFDVFFSGITAALVGMTALADTLDTDLLGRAVVIANAVAPIAAALKAWADAAAAVKGYVAIGAEIWGQMNLDFQNTLLTIDSWMALALKYVDKTAAFKDAMTSIAANLVDGLKIYSDGMKASSALISTIPQPTPITPSSFASQSFVRQSAGGSSVSIGTMPVTINLPPGATDGDGDIARRIFAEEIVKWMQSFRLVQSTA